MNFQQGYRPPSADKPKNGKKKKKWLYLLLTVALAALAGVGIYAGIQIHQQNEHNRALSSALSPYREAFLPNLYVDGIDLGGMTAQEGIDAVLGQINSRQNGWSLDLNYQGHLFYTLRYEDMGVSTDVASVYNLLEQLYSRGKVGTLEERKADMDALAAEPYHAYTTQSEITDERLNIILSQIAQQLTYDPADAYLAYFYPEADDPFIIQPEQYGSSLDVDSLREQILSRAAAGEGGALEITPDRIAPKVTAADIRAQVALRSKAVTPVSSASTADRTSNIRTAFSRLNGQTVSPGSTLSFNKVTKDRTLKNGYKYAIEYISGMEEIGVGGGVCQASTTLYLAALLSNLDIVERISHSDPVSYTTFGQDATVVYNRHDLVIRNTCEGTIYITAKVQEKRKNSYECVVCIYGPKLPDGVTYQLRTETTETIPAPLTETYQKDKDHTYVTYKDEDPYLVRKARDGFVNVTYLETYQDGNLVSEKFVSKDTCKPRGTVYAVGTLDRPE